ncbi:Dabb family protein [bacterium]|nr:Dabb family protein [bacterium]
MIKHVVAWDFPETDKIENITRLKALLEALPALISDFKSYEIGVNIKDSENAKDMILISAFEDAEALQRYVVHPEHQRVLKELRKIAQKTMVVDFQVF